MKKISYKDFCKVSVLILAVFVISGIFIHRAQADTQAALGVTQITATRTFATADNSFSDGWQWVFNVTVPDNQTLLKMKFADWVSGSNIIPAGSNIRIYSAQSVNAFDENHALVVPASGTYTDLMYLNPSVDLDALQGGRQIQIVVEARVPNGSAGGSYTTSYGINTTAPATVNISNLLATYNGTPQGVTITTDPADLATSVTYNGSTTVPTHAGTYTVYAEVTDPGYTGTSSATYTINPAPISAIADPQTKVYDNDPSTDPALTYHSIPTPFAGDSYTGTLARNPGENAGAYPITQGTLALSSDYLLTFVPNLFTITQAPATITLGNTEQTYDKTGKAVTASTTPANLSVDVTYDGSPELPINAGTYSVQAVITDPNYSGSQSGSLLIDPAPLTITAATDTKVYDATTKSSGLPMISSGALISPDTAVLTQTFDTKDVGTGKKIIPNAVITDDNGGNNYHVTYV
ncbi:MAG: hypothetical protein KGJ33_02485, partial [Patescibacteria group bacterium]|nr:hypothetical protein [Patescibacteria group bacterium]